MDFDIIEYVAEALEELNYTVIEGWYDDEIGDTHITFFEFLERTNDYLENDEASIEHNVQIDIWTKDSKEANELKNKVKKLLKAKDFIFEESSDNYETDTKIIHKAMRFSYIEEIL